VKGLFCVVRSLLIHNFSRSATNQISLTFVLLLVVWQCNLCSAGPGFVTIDAPQEPWKSRATVNKSSISTKLPTSLGDQKIVVATVTPSSPPTSSPSFSSFNPIKLSHEDVIKGSNSVYGSQSLTNGGIIFAFAGHHNSAPSSSSQLMSTGKFSHDFRAFKSTPANQHKASLNFSASTTSANAVPVLSGRAPVSGRSVHSTFAAHYDGSGTAVRSNGLHE